MTEGLFEPARNLVCGILGECGGRFRNLHSLWVRDLKEMYGLRLDLDHLSFR